MVSVKKNGYRADIDGLRAVAVMAVLLHHLAPDKVTGGYIGVDVFFVISGYLITGIISREIRESRFTFAGFYERRIRRLFPALLTVLAFVFVAGWFILLPSDYLATSRAAVGTLLFSANIFFWRVLGGGYFADDAKLNPLLHMWSLGVEEQFYLLFPPFLLLIHRYANRWLVPTLVASFTLSFALSVWLTPIKSVASYFLLPTRAWELLAGSLLAVASFPLPQARIWRELLAGASFIAIAAPAIFYSARTPFPGYAALIPVGGTVGLIWLGSGQATLAGRVLQFRPVVYVGLISYSLYLWHWPLIVFAKHLNGLDSLRPYIPVLFLMSIVVAAISHEVIERPFRRRGTNNWGRNPYVVLTVVVAVLLTMAGQSILSGGSPGRYPEAVVRDDATRDAPIPWLQCEQQIGNRLESLCVLGDASAKPDILLWGDSHMLAWAPGFAAALKSLGRSAYFAPNSNCPPIFDVDQSSDPRCRSQNDDVAVAIKDPRSGRPRVSLVILGGFWHKYFNESDAKLSSDRFGDSNWQVAGRGLSETIARLNGEGIVTLIMGDVPNYPVDVAYVVASGRGPGTKLRYGDMQSAPEYQFLSTLPGFVDVAAWFCSMDCRVADDDGVFYRDTDHLSPHGALRFQGHIANMLFAAVQGDARAAIETCGSGSCDPSLRR